MITLAAGVCRHPFASSAELRTEGFQCFVRSLHWARLSVSCSPCNSSPSREPGTEQCSGEHVASASSSCGPSGSPSSDSACEAAASSRGLAAWGLRAGLMLGNQERALFLERLRAPGPRSSCPSGGSQCPEQETLPLSVPGPLQRKPAKGRSERCRSASPSACKEPSLPPWGSMRPPPQAFVS